ncbi:MAG: glycogen synthase [Lentisphaerae bacterium]|nr:glycogen synthase [Lentisphaerota bacterium]
MSEVFGKRANPRILVVTPEITYLPPGMGNMANRLTAKAGGLADVSASLVSALFEMGADVHVALPHYRRMFHIEVANLISDELRIYQSKLPHTRIHLAEDRAFYYRDEVYSNYSEDNPKIATAFQREVLNNIIPRVNPDLIHCNDWMTGLIPAAARRMNIPCLFTLHNIHTHELPLAVIEDRGIDAASFWKYLYFKYPPRSYEESRAGNVVDLLASGIFASHFINTVSPSFLREIVEGQHDFIPGHVRNEIASKVRAGCAVGILNSPDATFHPQTDSMIHARFSSSDFVAGKRANKLDFQAKTGLAANPDAPLFFWPSRLDPIQKGCQLLTHILHDVVSAYWDDGIQIAIVANGSYQKHFHDIVRAHDFYDRVCVCDFDDPLSHLGYAASDFTLVPSRFEPCGLPQMVSCLYGSLPVVHETGGLKDTVEHISVENSTGNGFVFRVFDAGGLRWAIDRAMDFHRLPAPVREAQTRRVMIESAGRFTHQVTARRYFDIYEEMLKRPLVREF